MCDRSAAILDPARAVAGPDSTYAGVASIAPTANAARDPHRDRTLPAHGVEDRSGTGSRRGRDPSRRQAAAPRLPAIRCQRASVLSEEHENPPRASAACRVWAVESGRGRPTRSRTSDQQSL